MRALNSEIELNVVDGGSDCEVENDCEIERYETGNNNEFFAVESIQEVFGDVFHPRLLSELDKNEFRTLTQVQKMAINAILDNDDRHIMIRSQTGTGKTLAYFLPLVQKLQALNIGRQDGPYALILLPTRELAIQTFDLAQKLLKAFIRIVPTCLIGGMNRKHEKDRIRKGVNVVIGTPGRIEDHLQNTNTFSLENVRFVVLDEADRMLDMGFRKPITNILRAAENSQQTILSSATLTSSVMALSELHLPNPIFVDANIVDDCGVVKSILPRKLVHYFVEVSYRERLPALIGFIANKIDRKMLVFVSTNDSVRFHHELFAGQIMPDRQFYRLYGDLDLPTRRSTCKEFTNSKNGVLFCTDVAARGLDFPNVSWIVQYNCASSTQEYVHRVGRTARLDRKGKALLFLADHETECLKLISDFCSKQFRQLSKRKMLDSAQSLELDDLENEIVPNDRNLHELAVAGYVSFVRSYATFKREWKNAFHPRNLHLGHVAKSFALKDPPKDIAEQFLFKRKQKSQTQHLKPNKKFKSEQFSEFDSGL